jgi:hypothetical protein
MHSEPFEHPHVGEGLYGHETVTILTLLSGMTEAESAGLDFPCHLTRELGKSVFGNEDIVLMQALLSVSRSM